jgi:putative ABC transport system permease protein
VDVRDVNANPNVSWVLRGDRGLTYSGMLPEGNELVDGDWWPEDYQGPPLISLGDEIAEGLGLRVGDTLTLSVLGREITAEIANTRSIDWGTYGFNFVIIFAPGLLEAAPHTYMATVEADGAVEEATYVRVTDAFPGVTAIRMKEVLMSLNDLLVQIGTAIRITALVSILTGILVLAGAMAAGYSARAYDSVVLKVLGATRSDILKAYIVEYAILGGITGLIALGLGSTAAYFVVVNLFEGDWIWPPVPMISVLGFAIVLTVVFGLLTTWRVLSLRPYRLLSGL